PFLSYRMMSEKENQKVPIFRRRGCHIILVIALFIITIIAEIFINHGDKHSPPVSHLPRKSHEKEELRDILSNRAPYKQPISDFNIKTLNGTCPSAKLDPARVPDTCQLVHLSFFGRHGTRTPADTTIAAWDTLEKHLHTTKKSKWPEWLKNWKNPFRVGEGDHLTEAGKLELEGMAYRNACRYKNLFTNHKNDSLTSSIFDKKQANARHKLSNYASSEMIRCIDSALAYADLFSGRKLSQEDLFIVYEDRDSELDILGTCKKWSSLWESTLAKNMLPQLSRVFGYPISYDNYEVIVMTCLFEYSVFNQENHWCSLLQSYRANFTEQLPADIPTVDTPGSYGEHPSILELYDFVTDTSFYTKSGWGRPDNACYAVRTISRVFHNMQSAIKGYSRKMMEFGFTFDNTLLLMLTFMGFYKEAPTFNRNRIFRMSKLLPFGSNLQFEVFECDKKEDDIKRKDHFVRILLNEQPIELPECVGDGPLCPWEQFKALIQPKLSKCDFDEACRVV
ncbi:histidine phosphatase superfamily, partial [Syncephalis fuscata]